MGTSQSTPVYTSVTTDVYVREVRNVRSGMSNRDRRLYNFAKIQIAKEDLDDAEVTVDFQDQSSVVISATSRPSGKVYIGYNGYGYPEMVWQSCGFVRYVKRFFIGCFRSLRNALLESLAIEAGDASNAIAYY